VVAMNPAMVEVRVLTALKPLAYGKKAAATLAVYRARPSRVPPLAAVKLLAARCGTATPGARQRPARGAAPLYRMNAADPAQRGVGPTHPQ